jgi:pSer/pThr/pTyr-binding forkhead associated (FHA) protein
MSSEDIKITIMSGAEDGKVFILHNSPLTLGRHQEDDVYIPYDTRVSRHHARISHEDNAYYIEDVGSDGQGSKNCTYLNDKKVTSKTIITSGEMILLGAVWVKFESSVSANNRD